MPIGAETFVGAALQPLFERLFSLGEHLLLKLRNSGDMAEKLKEWQAELEMIGDVLDDAENRQLQSKAVKKWLDDLHDLALDMEDVLEDLNIEVQRLEFNTNLGRQEDADQLDSDRDSHPVTSVFGASVPLPVPAHGPANMVTSIISNLSTMFDGIDPGIQRKMEDNIGRLQAIHSRSQRWGLSAHILQQPTLQAEALRNKPESSSLEPEKVFGRVENKEDIVSQLLEGHHGDKNYVVIPIVGMGGIGKTTLAQHAYNDERVRGRFHLKAWVCVSDVLDVKRITTAIFKAVSGGGTAVEFSTLDEAQTELKQVLKSRMLLIVLDDIWNEEYAAWDQLQIPFQHAAKGSRVIMTTRNKYIARMMNTDPSHHNVVNLQGLSDDDCWRVFQQHASNDSNLTEMRDDIIKKCKGLPLAAKALGGLLKKTMDKKRRRMILESDPWSKEDGGLQVLRLSYYYLPPHLKHMFAYCSVLRKDYRFTKREIILLWMAQGFLPENEEERMEDLGEIYFDELRSRSLFEQSPDRKDKFVMHDLIHDVAQQAAGGMCYVMGTKDITQVDNWKRIRHVFVTFDGLTTLESLLPVASQLRTVYYNPEYIENLNLIKDFRYVRTLHLVSITIKVLTECIGDLQHLRFLSLQCWVLEELPTSIKNLWNLQTLSLKNCSKLKKIPNISSLKKLRHLEIEGTSLEEMPMGFEKVTNLQSLDKFVLGHGRRARLGELKDLNCLKGELRILSLENVSMPEVAREAQLHNKSTLNKLCLEWGNGRDEVDDDTEREVVEQLEPHSSIEECSLKYYRGSVFPKGPCLNNMVDIHLMCWKKCKSLPELGKLPLLKNLRIEGMDGIVEVGPEFYGNLTCTPPFPTLKSLSFMKMESWERWLLVDNDRAFPSLEILKINRCHSLRGDVPAHLPSLKKIKIEDCEELSVSVPLQSLPLLEKLVVKCDIQLIAAEGSVEEEHELPHLTTLTIRSSPSLISFPDGLVLPALKTLHIAECKNMVSLPSKMDKYTSLHRLKVYESPKLQCFPEGGLPINLKELVILGVKLMAWELHRLHSLQDLDLRFIDTEEDLSLPSSVSKIMILKNPKVKKLSVGNGNTTLSRLDFEDCPELESVVGSFTSLSDLFLFRCPKLQSLPGNGLPLNLTDLYIDEVRVDKPIREWGLNLLTSLRDLGLVDVGRCADAVERIPDDLQLPSSLSSLIIHGFQNLKSISWSTLPNLTKSTIRNCPRLESFADNALPPQLQKVDILGCDLIKPRLVRDLGGRISMDCDEWSLR